MSIANPNTWKNLTGLLSLVSVISIGGDTHVAKFLHGRQNASLFLPKNCWNWLKVLLRIKRLFLRSMAVFAALDHWLFWRKALNLPPFSMVCTQLKRVANLHSIWPFYCGKCGAVYSMSTPSPSCLQVFLKATFSPALSQHRYCNCILYLFFRF